MEVTIDPVAVAIAILTVILGPKLAPYVGTYIVIAAAGLTGAAFSLGRREPGAKLGTWPFLCLMVAFSMLLTVGFTQLAALVWSPLGSNYMIAPVALVVGYLGDDWAALFKWAGERLGRLLERRVGG